MKIALTEKQDGAARIKSLRNQKLFDGNKIKPFKDEFFVSLNLSSPGRVKKDWSVYNYLVDHISERKYKFHWGMLAGIQKFENKINTAKFEKLHNECEVRLRTKEEITWLDLAYLGMIKTVFQQDYALTRWADANLAMLYKYSPETEAAQSKFLNK